MQHRIMVMRTPQRKSWPPKLGMLHMPSKLPEKIQIIPLFLSTQGKHNSRNDHRTRHGMAKWVDLLIIHYQLLKMKLKYRKLYSTKEMIGLVTVCIWLLSITLASNFHTFQSCQTLLWVLYVIWPLQVLFGQPFFFLSFGTQLHIF
jgi:hypothetical protein